MDTIIIYSTNINLEVFYLNILQYASHRYALYYEDLIIGTLRV